MDENRKRSSIGDYYDGNDAVVKRSRTPATSFGERNGEFEALTAWLSNDALVKRSPTPATSFGGEIGEFEALTAWMNNDAPVKRSRTPATSFGGEIGEFEALTAWMSTDAAATAAASELSELLATEFVSPVKVKFVTYPYTTTAFQPSASYVTINCNDETCGSSFSDSDSSVMASVDTGGVHISSYYDDVRYFRSFSSHDFQVASGACGLDGVTARGFDDGKMMMICGGGDDSEARKISGSDCSEFCDEMLARFLGEDLPEE